MPVILSKPDGKHAMGVWSPDQPSKGYEGAGYGRFRFPAEKVVKWNCVFRFRDADGVKPGARTFRVFAVLGTLDDVTHALAGLVKAHAERR